MRLLDLFSGIGGFSLSASWAGIETVAFCEREPFCQAVLKKHWPDVPIVSDIHDLRGDEYGPVDIISGGFPCQPFSVAGKRGGQGDDRFLWPEMLRVIKTARPTWVLGENVPGIIGLALDQVLSDLEALGYSTQTLIIPACAVDAPHRRDRVWIVAHSDIRQRNRQKRKIRTRRNTIDGCRENVAHSAVGKDHGRNGRSMDEAERRQEGIYSTSIAGGEDVAHANAQPSAERREQSMGRRPSQAARLGERCEDVANAEGNGLQRERTLRGTFSAARRGTRESERGGYGPNRWPIEPNVGRVVDGVSSFMDRIGGVPIKSAPIPKKRKSSAGRAHRLKSLGNAIVPQVAYQLFKAMVAVS